MPRGFHCEFHIPTDTAIDPFWVSFIDAVEGAGLACGGGIDRTGRCTYFIYGNGCTTEARGKILAWLLEQPAIQDITVGKIGESNG